MEPSCCIDLCDSISAQILALKLKNNSYLEFMTLLGSELLGLLVNDVKLTRACLYFCLQIRKLLLRGGRMFEFKHI